MSREAAKLAEATGCLPQEAASVLAVEPAWEDALASVGAIMAARRTRYGSGILDVWRRFAEPAYTDGQLIDVAFFDVGQTIAFFQGLGTELEDPVVLCVAYELQAPEVGKVGQQGFIDGWARLEAGSMDEMKASVARLRSEFQDSAYFQTVYRYTFGFVLEATSKKLSRETADAYWSLLLRPRFGDLVDKWLAFEERVGVEAVSKDLWNMLLEFCQYTKEDPQLISYDLSCAWPAIIDDFVDTLR